MSSEETALAEVLVSHASQTVRQLQAKEQSAWSHEPGFRGTVTRILATPIRLFFNTGTYQILAEPGTHAHVPEYIL